MWITNRSFIHYAVVLTIATIVCFSTINQSLSYALPLVVSQKKTDGSQQQVLPLLHDIKMAAVELPDGHTAYKMLEYKTIDKQNSTTDITSRYSNQPVIPGPTIVLTEGDIARLTLVNQIGRGSISIHTHGVHYTNTSDGTLKRTNSISDQGATSEKSYTYI